MVITEQECKTRLFNSHVTSYAYTRKSTTFIRNGRCGHHECTTRVRAQNVRAAVAAAPIGWIFPGSSPWRRQPETYILRPTCLPSTTMTVLSIRRRTNHSHLSQAQHVARPGIRLNTYLASMAVEHVVHHNELISSRVELHCRERPRAPAIRHGL